ncbi:MAG: DUF4331 domain-containing protein [Gammaproteobacteria bacterium]
MILTTKKHKSKLATTIASILLGSAVALTANASSHREAPNITEKPKVDNTDFYMFNSYEPGRDGYVTLLANYIPLQFPNAGPNYFSMDPDALYSIKIDNDGDAKPDITFRFRFKNKLANNGRGIEVPVGDKMIAIPLKHAGLISTTDKSNLGFNESYKIDVVYGSARKRGNHNTIRDAANKTRYFEKPYDNVGEKTFNSSADYELYARSLIHNFDIPGCGVPAAKVFVGQRKEGFAISLGKNFDLINYNPGSTTQDPANNDLANKNITTIALEVHKSCLVGQGNGVIGGWSTASERQVRILHPRASFKYPEINGGAWTQVSRLGNPLVNELVIGLRDKNLFNATKPKRDGIFADYVTNPSLPFIINLLFGSPSAPSIAPSNIPRTDLVATFLTGFAGLNQLKNVTPSEMLRLNTAVNPTPQAAQNSLGVLADDTAGFPNGRRPGDDVVDAALRVVMGALCNPVTLTVNGAVAVDNQNLGYCTPQQAPFGLVPLTDSTPISAMDFDNEFPYLLSPVPGSIK